MERGMRWRVVAASLAAAVSVCSCAYIVHPERRGNTGGNIDGTSLVCDLLWLLPGLIPGIVALSVDFGSGAIYTGGSAAEDVQTPGRIVAHVPALAVPTRLELRLVDRDGTVYDRDGATLAAGAPPTALAVKLDRLAMRRHGRDTGDLYLELANGEGRTARLALPMEVRP